MYKLNILNVATFMHKVNPETSPKFFFEVLKAVSFLPNKILWTEPHTTNPQY